MLNKQINDFVKNFVNKDAKKNVPILLVSVLLMYSTLSFLLFKLINSLLGNKSSTMKDFLSVSNSSIRGLCLIIIAALFTYIIYQIFFTSNKRNEANNLGSAQMGTYRNLAGLTGSDGLVLSKGVRLKESSCFEHVAIIGPTGSGKSSTFFINNLLDIPPEASIVITDPKGELYQKTKEYNEKIGRQCILFAPLEPQHSVKYNPLDAANSVTEIREIAQNLLVNGANAVALASGKQGGGDSEWINMSVPLWTAALLFCKQQGGAIGNITSALKLLLEKDDNTIDLLFSNASDEVKTQYNIYKQASGSEKTASSIKTVLSSNLQLFTDPDLAFVTEKSEFHPYLLKDKPTAIFIKCAERQSNYASPFMSVFYAQIINKLMEYKGRDLPVYMMYDEFSNIGIIPSFATLVATCRSRKLSITIGIQGIEQLYQNYGKEGGDNILNNLKAKVFYPGLAPATAEIASKLCGFTTIQTQSVSEGKERENRTKSTNYQRRELLDPDEIRRLPDDEVLLVIHNREPVIDKQNKYYLEKKYTSKVSNAAFPIRNDYKQNSSMFSSNYAYKK